MDYFCSLNGKREITICENFNVYINVIYLLPVTRIMKSTGHKLENGPPVEPLHDLISSERYIDSLGMLKMYFSLYIF